ncbi:MAG TPA: hypothetical protein VHB79_34825 [Polyangiaceae bacterium]|nr:hypothetical protein [Polyangiaceae bacterium]
MRRASLVAAICVACSSQSPISARDAADANDVGSSTPARTALERSVLQELPKLPSGVARPFANATVTADAPYAAASGRTCRAIHLGGVTTGKSELLACSSGADWFFVPDVFGATE